MELPPPDHVYGIKSNLEGEGAGAVIGAWAEHAYVALPDATFVFPT
jgi:hypothetical protein